MARYKDSGKIYQSDRCETLVNAIEHNEAELNALVRDEYPGRPLEEDELPGVKTIGYWNTLKEQSWGLDWHRNEGIELTFMVNGGLDYLLGDTVYPLEANYMTLARPWQPHKVGNPNVGIGKLFWIIIDVGVRRPNQEWKWPSWLLLSKSEIEELTRFLRENERPVWRDPGQIRPVILKLLSTLEESFEEHNTTRMAILINELLYTTLDLLRNSDLSLKKNLTSNRRNVELFLEDLSRHLHIDWSVEAMAEECEIGKTRFIEYCKRITNMSPVQYLTYLRIEDAAVRLKSEPERSILDIALDCGFSSSQYFANLFKKQKGITPSRFREPN